MTRRQVRETALQILYEIEVSKGELKRVLERNIEHKGLNKQNTDFLEKLVIGVVENVSDIDGIISRLSKEWDINRLAYVDKNILRMGLYEIFYIPDIPYSVSINEAVELAKKFAGNDSPRFINGILDNAVKYEGAKNDN